MPTYGLFCNRADLFRLNGGADRTGLRSDATAGAHAAAARLHRLPSRKCGVPRASARAYGHNVIDSMPSPGLFVLGFGT